jgi:class 3 adenylate cyclase
MRTCGACGAANPATSRFCGSCGAPLAGLRCPSCAALNPEGAHFCGQCGTALEGAPAPTPVAVEERKLATVLFADVVGFTSLAERTDAEAVARTVDSAFRRLGDVVAEYGGTVDKYMGDSLLAVFGVPAAHDDDAERAVAAGLAMREVGGDLAFSIGINTGEVMVTSLVDGQTTVIGDAVNVAARLEKAAAAGQVLVGELTARLAGRRVLFDEGRPLVVKGKREPVNVFAAVGLRDSGHQHEDDAGRPPLVGREADLAFLLAQWERTVAERRPGMVLVVGEPGVGTTRLVEELCTRVSPYATSPPPPTPPTVPSVALGWRPSWPASSGRWATPTSTSGSARRQESSIRRCAASIPRPSGRSRCGASAGCSRTRPRTSPCLSSSTTPTAPATRRSS